MPITYKLEPDFGIVYHEFTGEICLSEFEQYWRTLLTDPSVPDPLVLYADLRCCSLMVHGDDVRRIVREVIEPQLRGRRWVSAAVVASPADYGVTKQFMFYSNDCGVTEVFHDKDEAVSWLMRTASSWTLSDQGNQAEA